ncbi:hypothetical protein AXF42_Ash004243 [Apostasia shenzhenica]|uniref:Uncharacterized protein n=1 Tax=Apostasia shenzhenica TaxID=1088818 RepID=A0A2I0A2C3_9ASPA|nr:hypothetical protein AXF42_Ash004243 [Apostasia shenzhenica]
MERIWVDLDPIRFLIRSGYIGIGSGSGSTRSGSDPLTGLAVLVTISLARPHCSPYKDTFFRPVNQGFACPSYHGSLEVVPILKVSILLLLLLVPPTANKRHEPRTCYFPNRSFLPLLHSPSLFCSFPFGSRPLEFVHRETFLALQVGVWIYDSGKVLREVKIVEIPCAFEEIVYSLDLDWIW